MRALETTIQNINSTLLDFKQEVRSGFEKMDRRFETFDRRFETIDQKIDHLRNLVWSNFLWIMGIMIGIAGLIACAHHWI